MRILHHWPLDPASRAARLALAEKGLDVDLEEARPWLRAEPLFRLNPAGGLPVLEDNGATIAEVAPVLEYLEEAYPGQPLMPRGAVERAEVRRLIGWFDGKYNGEVNAYLLHEKLEKRAQSLGAPDPQAIRDGRDHLRWHMDYLSGLLDEREGLAGPRFTLADIIAAAHLSCADYLGDVPFDEFAPVKNWYARIKCRPAFRGLLADRLPGLPPAKHYDDLDF
ncbi:glutathione S-transferase family protein [Hyphobacterium sp.]|jgi:glutathione S-transferase|uniref:FtsZ-binding protein FzlA n=1 Tax=Hyphobacterium sp. TaxID=2004662 RepID=UPI003BAC175E